MLEKIKNAAPEELDQILQAVLARYREVHPDWEIMFLSLDKKENKKKQIDSIIALLNQIKL